jgi:hypothetical protein
MTMPRATRRSCRARRPAAVLAGAAAVLALAACGAEDPSHTVTAPPRASAPAGPAPAQLPPGEPTAAPGPTVQEIAGALDAIHPTRHPRDNTGSCAGTAGCLGLITTGTVSIYQWPSVTAASRFIGEGAGTADRIGPYVLSYRSTEQHSTPPQVRRAYADKVRAMVGPVP